MFFETIAKFDTFQFFVGYLMVSPWSEILMIKYAIVAMESGPVKLVRHSLYNNLHKYAFCVFLKILMGIPEFGDQ